MIDTPIRATKTLKGGTRVACEKRGCVKLLGGRQRGGRTKAMPGTA
jgi:hypothetical protein